MPSKRHTKKDKKQQKGKKQKNTTFKKGGASKTLAEIVKEKLEADDYKLVQQLIEHPDRKYYIMLLFCDNKIIVNTSVLLKPTYSAPKEGYNTYKNSLTIPDQFEKDKVLKIIVYANDDGIQYNTIVDDQGIMQHICKNETLPVIYNIPEITAPSDIISSADLTSESNESMPEGEELKDIWSESIPYDEDLTSPNDIVEQASINMRDLQVEDLENVTDIAQSRAIEPNDVSKELKETIKGKELEGVSEKPELKDFKDDLELLKKKTPKSGLQSREEGDINTIGPKIDLKELAREQKEAKRKQQEEIDRLAHEARLKAEEEAKKKQEEDIDDESEMLFEEISDSEAEEEEMRENQYQQFERYIDEIEIISGILQSILLSGQISSDKIHRSDYTPALRQLKTKYDALIDIFNNDNTHKIPKNIKDKIINVLKNNHRRLQALRKYDKASLVPKLNFESNFMDKVQDSLSIMNTLNTYFKTLDESLMHNFGNKPHVSYDYIKYVHGGKKTRKNRRKTQQRKTKKRT